MYSRHYKYYIVNTLDFFFYVPLKGIDFHLFVLADNSFDRTKTANCVSWRAAQTSVSFFLSLVGAWSLSHICVVWELDGNLIQVYTQILELPPLALSFLRLFPHFLVILVS